MRDERVRGETKRQKEIHRKRNTKRNRTNQHQSACPDLVIHAKRPHLREFYTKMSMYT